MSVNDQETRERQRTNGSARGGAMPGGAGMMGGMMGTPDKEVIDKFVDTEGDLPRIDKRNLHKDFEGITFATQGLTVRTEEELWVRSIEHMLDREFYELLHPNPASVWQGESRAELFDDEDEQRVALDPEGRRGMETTYMIAMDQARQSRNGGRLLDQLTKFMSIQEVKTDEERKKKSWWSKLLPGR